ncbi:MAG: hypothetical protein QOJ42_3700 [Acidobacteriaceae bacterium]|nr:hypothetical protein [Acidobacteriaceae bacterium]
MRSLKPRGDGKPGALVMGSIPLDLERRLEQRWTARFSGPLQKHRLEEQRQHTAQSKRQRKTRRREPAGPKART